MTLTLTQQVEQVLMEELGSSAAQTLQHLTFNRKNGQSQWYHLIERLCALLSPTAPPSREELDKIFAEFFQAKYPGLPGAPPAMYNLSELSKTVMAWAAPRPLRKEELEKIVSEFFQATYTMQPHDPKAMYNLSELIAQIWSWLSGPREAKELPSPCPQPSLIQTSLLSLSPDFGVCRCCKKCPSCCQCIGQPRPAG